MKNQQFLEDVIDVINRYEKLEVVAEDGYKFLRGSVDIIDEEGQLWDTYKIEVKPSTDYPYQFPKLFETEGSFPKIADWHVYEDDGSCCIDVPTNERIICKEGISILEYIDKYAIPYLANQTHRKIEGYYLHGEYSHGLLGRLEYYQSILNATNASQLQKMLGYLSKGILPLRQAICPFCNNKKFRHCHRTGYTKLSDVSIKRFIIYDFKQLSHLLKLNPALKLPLFQSQLIQ